VRRTPPLVGVCNLGVFGNDEKYFDGRKRSLAFHKFSDANDPQPDFAKIRSVLVWPCGLAICQSVPTAFALTAKVRASVLGRIAIFCAVIDVPICA
jgi:hypothetical protein